MTDIPRMGLEPSPRSLATVRDRLNSRAVLVGIDGLVERSDLPDWWTDRGNILLARSDVLLPPILAHPGVPPPENAVIVLADSGSQIGSCTVWGDECTIAVGMGAILPASQLICGTGATICIDGLHSSSINATLNARNGGRIQVMPGGLWSSGILIFTDDMHAIRSAVDGRRLNQRGGTVIVERHVWLGMDVLLLPGVTVGENSVVGARSVVTSNIPAGSVAAGSPARVLRSDVTWTHEDEP